MENYEKSVAMSATQQMRGVVIISLPRSDCEGGKTMCAAMWQQGQEQQQVQEQVQVQQQVPEQQLVQQEQPPPPPAAPTAPPPHHRWGRPVSKWKRFRRRVFWPLVLLLFLYLVYKLPSLYYSEMELEENEEKNVHVYTLHPKYTSVPIKMSVVRRNLLDRDLKRLGKASVPENSAANNRTAFYPVRGNIYPDGLYYMAMLIGNPAKLYYLDMDTGSDLTWLQCDAPCRSCAVGPHGLYDPKKGRLVDCRQPICAQVQQGGSYTCGGRVRQCDYDVDYADGSSTMGILMEDTITLFLTNGTRSQTRAIIGCGYDQQGTLAQTPAATDGVMGLSSSKISLPSQLAKKGIVNNVIGHCLAGGSNGGGYLFFGDALVPAFGVTWTPMMGRPVMEGYQARLRTIRYGVNELKLADKTGDVGSAMFDSGTSFTYLVPEAYEAVLQAVKNQAEIISGLVRVTTDTTLPFCWRGTSPFESVGDVNQYFKTVTLDFGGSSWFSASKTLELSPEGYLIVSTQGNVCLGILNASGASLEVTNIIGGMKQPLLVVMQFIYEPNLSVLHYCAISTRRTKVSS
ncbi:hypothetical protein KC19_10G117900 [Ceratodon purpureus]|uniref:Peptidase A1 domain-containing protein n=1 Tax=Ceratodon purpureus TaxID=3225 RepID=A0A8T0GJA3_CERPU|nr:hypothetical protein KC19_10G117900 [Ceratodon purpureus]